MANDIVKQQVSSLKSFMTDGGFLRQIQGTLKEKSGSFTNALINVVENNAAIAKCNPESICIAAMNAATLDLQLNPNLGQAAIVPYGANAQFQIMWKGLVQLAMRSGQFKSIVSNEVYADEIVSFNPITEQIVFVDDFSACKDRNDKSNTPCGYYAMFELVNGFKKEAYWTHERVESHAKKFSKTYNNSSGVWKTNFIAMAKKTVLKMILNGYAPLSIQMQKGISLDQQVDGEYKDNPMKDVDSNVVDEQKPTGFKQGRNSTKKPKNKVEEKEEVKEAGSIPEALNQELVDGCKQGGDIFPEVLKEFLDNSGLENIDSITSNEVLQELYDTLKGAAK